jgi:ABC-type transporter Mla subunit MlaD
MIEEFDEILRSNLEFLSDLFADKIFYDQLLTWVFIDGLLFLTVLFTIILPVIIKLVLGVRVLKMALKDEVDLSTTEQYEKSITIISESKLVDDITAKWITIQKRLTTLQRSDFIEHVKSNTPSVHMTLYSIARFFLLGGLFFTFASLSDTFLDFKSVEQEAHITFVQSRLIPNVGTALTSTLVAIIFSIGSIGIASMIQGYSNRFCSILEQFLIEKVSPQHQLQNAERNLSTLIDAQKEMSSLVQGTIKELRNVADITNTAYSDLSDATYKFVQAFDSTQQVIRHVDTNQEQIVEQNKKILLAASALQDSVIGIQRVFELENSAMREVKESIQGSNDAIERNAEQVQSITIKFDDYNDKIRGALSSSIDVLDKMNEGLSTLSTSNEANRAQVSSYVSLLNNNSDSLNKVLRELSLIVDDAKSVETNIKTEAEKISSATENIEEIGKSADDISTVGSQLDRVSGKLNTIAERTSKAYDDFSNDLSSAQTVLKNQVEISSDLDNISRVSQNMSRVGIEARSTQNEISANTKRLEHISNNFSKTYKKYISQLSNNSIKPGFYKRLISLFRR